MKVVFYFFRRMKDKKLPGSPPQRKRFPSPMNGQKKVGDLDLGVECSYSSNERSGMNEEEEEEEEEEEVVVVQRPKCDYGKYHLRRLPSICTYGSCSTVL